MRLRTLIPAVLVLTSLPAGAVAQDAASVVAAASKAMAVDTLNSITYSGSARTGTFGQSKSIGEPMGPVNVTQITQYRRTINFVQAADPAALVSRATGPTQPPAVPGVPPPTPGVFNQNITGAQAVSSWTQGLNIWTTPWGFLKGAAANTPTVRQQSGVQVVSFTPPNLKSPSGETYSVTGYINPQNLVTKVETRVEHAVAGDLLVEFEYSNYHNMNGVQVPGRIVQRQAGLETFDAAITSATPNPPNLAELLTLPPPAAGAAPAGGAPPAAPAGPPPVEKIGDGVFKIGGNYTSLAVDMGDHILVIESGQNDARGMAVMAAAKQAIPNQPIRFVVNSHAHFDHAGGLGAAVAEGATILTYQHQRVGARAAPYRPADAHGRQPLEGVRSAHGCGSAHRRPRRAKGRERQGRRAPPRADRTQRWPARGLPAGGEAPVDGGPHGRESYARAARSPEVRGRDLRPSQARLQHLAAGSPADSRQAADEGRCHGGGRRRREVDAGSAVGKYVGRHPQSRTSTVLFELQPRAATPPPTRRPDPPSSRVAFRSRSDRSRSR